MGNQPREVAGKTDVSRGIFALIIRDEYFTENFTNV
jgi:hypothetical protein